MVRLIVLALALGLSAPATAQVSTTCHTDAGGDVTCSTSPGAPITEADAGIKPPSRWETFMFGTDRRDAQMARKAAGEALVRKRTVSLLVAEGRCKEAVGVALKAGDMDLATQAKMVCEPTP